MNSHPTGPHKWFLFYTTLTQMSNLDTSQGFITLPSPKTKYQEKQNPACKPFLRQAANLNKRGLQRERREISQQCNNFS